MSASSTNHQKFTIQDNGRAIRKGEIIEITFIAQSTSSAVQFSNLIRRVKLNEHEICHNNDADSIDESCVELEMIDGPSEGRFDGLLTIFPKFSSNALQVIVEVDNPAFALGVS